MPFAPTIGVGWTATSNAGSVPPAQADISPGVTITVSRDADNPTLDALALPENIIKVGSTYYLVYQGGSTAADIKLASASAPEGPWSVVGTILTGGSQAWETNRLYAPFIYAESGTYYVFYSSDPTGTGGTNYSIGVATASSVTGPYSKHSGNPILAKGAGADWDALRVGEAAVIKVGSTYYMYYMGEAGTYPADFQESEQIGVATATSITGTWTKDPDNPVLTFGSGGSWDDWTIADPDVIFANGRYWMLYTGSKSTEPTTWKLGFAYSDNPDGPWTKHTSNPILTGDGSGWDALITFRGGVYNEAGIYHLIYVGHPNVAVALSNMKGGNGVLVFS